MQQNSVDGAQIMLFDSFTDNLIGRQQHHIAIVMGGYSSEVDISLQSGKVVCDSLDTSLYDIYTIHILKDTWKMQA